MEAALRFELRVEVLQTSALPLGYAAQGAPILIEHDMKFNRRLIGYLIIYIAGCIYLILNNGTLATALLFGLITIIGISIKPRMTQTASLSPMLDSDLRMAKGVQEAIMDLPIPNVDGIIINRFYLPADWVGGDFTFFHSRENDRFSAAQSGITGVVKWVSHQETFISVSIGDVAGHGVSSALIMALTTGLLSEVAQSSITPADVLDRVNAHLSSHISQSDIRYVTCMYLTIYPQSRRLQYCRAGHPPAFVIRKDGKCIDLDSPGVFLGMFSDEKYTNSEMTLEAGDRIVLYSDGITETRNSIRDEFGIDQLKAILINTRFEPASKAIFHLKNAVSEFGPLNDDQTMILIDVS